MPIKKKMITGTTVRDAAGTIKSVVGTGVNNIINNTTKAANRIQGKHPPITFAPIKEPTPTLGVANTIKNINENPIDADKLNKLEKNQFARKIKQRKFNIAGVKSGPIQSPKKR